MINTIDQLGYQYFYTNMGYLIIKKNNNYEVWTLADNARVDNNIQYITFRHGDYKYHGNITEECAIVIKASSERDALVYTLRDNIVEWYIKNPKNPTHTVITNTPINIPRKAHRKNVNKISRNRC